MAEFFNENVIKGKWNEFKGELQKAWGRLTDDEVESAKGDMNAISGLVQRKYGLGQEEIRSKINDMVSRFGSDNSDNSENQTSSASAENDETQH